MNIFEMQEETHFSKVTGTAEQFFLAKECAQYWLTT